MAKTGINIQDGFLFQNLKAGAMMEVGLITGATLEGPLKRFDRFAVVVETGGVEVLVYKHAIATLRQLEEVGESN